MWYRKSLQVWERAVRVTGALALIAYGLIGLSGLAVGYLLVAAGLFTGFMGFIGFYPACTLAGRRLKRGE